MVDSRPKERPNIRSARPGPGAVAVSQTALTSRQCVFFKPRLSAQVLALFSQNAPFFALFGLKLLPICVQNTRNLQHQKKSFSFVFKYFLASFPRFSTFCSDPLSRARREHRILFWASGVVGLAHDNMSTK